MDTPLDLGILIGYLVIVMGGGFVLARRQHTPADYYVAGRRLRSGWVAFSILATQVSAISLLGAPAFVAVRANGGLVWLQYEFAVPLAMLVLIAVVAPVLRRGRYITIYEYVHARFGNGARVVLAATFLLARGLASGVALYAVALPIALTFDVSLAAAMLFVGGFAILYTTVGGIEADVFSDVVQLIVLVGVTIVLVFIAIDGLGGPTAALAAVPAERARVIDLASHGLGDGQDFAFWPMLIGGFFLYLSYYGVDQSQAQRYLSTPDVRSAQRSLLWNGLFRGVIAALYCFLGLLLAGWLATRPDFAAAVMADRPDALVPRFVLDYAPTGVRGLFLAGLLAAAMSTLDSNYNSLSAVTVRDFLGWDDQHPHRLIAARALTLLWGALCTAAAFLFANTGQTVIETVNQIGSLFYGPVLGLFVLGILSRRATTTGALTGLALGLLTNTVLWLAAPGISWMWWNAIGFTVAIATGGLLTLLQRGPAPTRVEQETTPDPHLPLPLATATLLLAFIVMLAVATRIPSWFS